MGDVMMKRVLLAILLCCLCFPALAEETVVITFGGDCVLGTREEWKDTPGTFDEVIAREGLAYPFGGIEAIFREDDLTVVNLECALTPSSKGHDYTKQHTFRGDPSYARMLLPAGIEMVNLANNHYIDYGRTGRAATVAALEDASVQYCGYGYRAIVELAGHRIGLGGCRETVWKASAATVYRDIQALRKAGCEAVIYFTHWGKEYSETHNKTQARMAQYAVNSGADLIIGSHPHVPQGISMVDGVPVVWSLGNLCFGGTHELRSFDGLLVQATLHFDDSGYTGCDLKLYPILTSGERPDNDFRPILAAGDEKERILDLVQQDSELDIRQPLSFPSSNRK